MANKFKVGDKVSLSYDVLSTGNRAYWLAKRDIPAQIMEMRRGRVLISWTDGVSGWFDVDLVTMAKVQYELGL